MEYLMTYGWAILIIAVVLAAFVALGIFNNSNLLGSQCVAYAGFLCQSPILNSSGQLSFTFGNNAGQVYYNVELACAAYTTALPSNTLAWRVLQYNGIAISPTNALVANALIMINGQSLTVTQLPCYGDNNKPIGNSLIGQAYSGYIWMNYTQGPGICIPDKASCAWLTTRIAGMNLKVV